ncbi:MAG TPA: agmatine deiminase family protein [Rhodanobacteraceae bacterium]|nr:agmatine deiminase family protein [Rhodanobacteraceae bacterium]
MDSPELRLPAEWEPQSAVLLAWPHAGTDWAERLDSVEDTCAALIAAITRFETAVVCVPDAEIGAHAAECLREAGANIERVRFIEIPYDDTWLRDSGPIILKSGTGYPAAARTRQVRHMSGLASDESCDSRSAHPCADEHDRYILLDFRFTGWGGKFEASRDDALVAGLIERGTFGRDAHHQRVDWALEGGAIESDGRGTILTTRKCLQQRHPDQSREMIELTLRNVLSAQRVLWLDHGYLQGDDTDAHVDTLARFAPDDAIVFQACSDPDDPHYEELNAMRREIEALRTLAGKPYRLFPLPWPKPITDEGRRLAASYANYLIVNGAVLVPAYGDAVDDAAAQTIALAHPGREVIQIPCRPLIWQNGSLHCMTMQLPQGALA